MMIALMVGCSAYSDVSTEAPYAPLIGKVFQTKAPLVVYKSLASDPIALIDRPGSDFIPVLNDLPKKFPANENGVYLLGVLNAGSLLRVTKAVRFHSSTMGDVYCYAVIQGQSDFENVTINTAMLGINSGGHYDSSLIEEVSRPAR
jgi:hypothetical protein